MGEHANLVGKQFNRLFVLEFSHRDAHGNLYWLCECCCGSIRTVQGGGLKAGRTQSCGCYHKHVVTTHGKTNAAEYRAWLSMRQRCKNSSVESYKYYGGKGVFVVSSWDSFEQFYADMGPRPSKDHSLDRKDGDGPYCKENCRWATRKEQQNNRASCRLLTYNGRTQTMIQWSEELGIPYTTLHMRLSTGWSVERALTQPVKQKGPNDKA